LLLLLTASVQGPCRHTQIRKKTYVLHHTQPMNVIQATIPIYTDRQTQQSTDSRQRFFWKLLKTVVLFIAHRQNKNKIVLKWK